MVRLGGRACMWTDRHRQIETADSQTEEQQTARETLQVVTHTRMLTSLLDCVPNHLRTEYRYNQTDAKDAALSADAGGGHLVCVAIVSFVIAPPSHYLRPSLTRGVG